MSDVQYEVVSPKEVKTNPALKVSLVQRKDMCDGSPTLTLNRIPIACLDDNGRLYLWSMNFIEAERLRKLGIQINNIDVIETR